MPKQTKGEAGATKAAAKKTTPKERKEKALKAQKAIKKGNFSKTKRSIRTSVHFHLPKTHQQPRAPKYPRHSVPSKSALTKVFLIAYKDHISLVSILSGSNAIFRLTCQVRQTRPIRALLAFF